MVNFSELNLRSRLFFSLWSYFHVFSILLAATSFLCVQFCVCFCFICFDSSCDSSGLCFPVGLVGVPNTSSTSTPKGLESPQLLARMKAACLLRVAQNLGDTGQGPSQKRKAMHLIPYITCSGDVPSAS